MGNTPVSEKRIQIAIPVSLHKIIMEGAKREGVKMSVFLEGKTIVPIEKKVP
jgi:hypothetical protein